MRALMIAFVLLMLALDVAVVGQSQVQKKFMGGPVTIEDQGSFFIGGVTKVSEHAAVPFAPPGQPVPARTPQQITIGQMYVQFQIPARQAGAGWPVIMVHGSTHTGAALESTPDGREGWFPYFVRKGVATYVVDQSGRGRSGFDQSVLHEAEAKLNAGDAKAAAELIPAFGRITDNGAWTAWFGHLVPAGSTVATGRLIPHASAEDPDKGTDERAARGAALPDERRGGVLQAAGAQRRGHAARLDVRVVQPASPVAGQHVDAAEPGAPGRAAGRGHRGHALPVRASWAITWSGSSRSAASWTW